MNHRRLLDLACCCFVCLFFSSIWALFLLAYTRRRLVLGISATWQSNPRILAGCHDNPLALAAKASWPKLMPRVVSGINWQLVCRVRSGTRSWCSSYEYLHHTWIDGRALRRSPTDRLQRFKFELGSHGSTMKSSTFVASSRRRLYIAMFISRMST